MSDVVIVTGGMMVFLMLLAAWNLILFRRRRIADIPEDQLPYVSVLVPARNEQRTIGPCIISLARQNYPRYEIIVLDDNSADNTASIARGFGLMFPAVRVLSGMPLPKGWVGKNYACDQLARAARGEWLLFTDADTVHEPDALRKAVTTALHRKADLLTLLPRQVMGTMTERLVLPLLHFISFSLLPFLFIERNRDPRFAIGVGQYMLFRRGAYEAIGGHASMKAAIVEDVWLARAVKAHGFRLVFADGTDTVRCRMYRGAGDVWRGFSKNVFAGLNFSPIALAGVLLLFMVLFAAPFIVLAAAALVPGLVPPAVVVAALVQAGANYLIRFALAVRFRLGLLSALLHPIGVLFVVAIALNSWRWIALGSGAQWKGRVYERSMLTGVLSPEQGAR